MYPKWKGQLCLDHWLAAKSKSQVKKIQYWHKSEWCWLIRNKIQKLEIIFYVDEEWCYREVFLCELRTRYSMIVRWSLISSAAEVWNPFLRKNRMMQNEGGGSCAHLTRSTQCVPRMAKLRALNYNYRRGGDSSKGKWARWGWNRQGKSQGRWEEKWYRNQQNQRQSGITLSIHPKRRRCLWNDLQTVLVNEHVWMPLWNTWQ